MIIIGGLLISKSNLSQLSADSAPNPMLGNILCILGQALLSVMFLYEEYVLKKYKIDTLYMVGWEGVWGLFFSGICLIISFCFSSKLH